jgi:pimeloyl-ACP methyl ester carboxylesterase
MIAPDRPGYGLSRPDKHGTLLGYVDDIVELADALKIDRFAVMGVSGGGPYPLACAYKIPQRVTVAALISSIGPLSLPDSTRDMLRMNKIMFTLGRLSPALTGLLLPPLIKSSLPSMERHVQHGIIDRRKPAQVLQKRSRSRHNTHVACDWPGDHRFKRLAFQEDISIA